MHEKTINQKEEELLIHEFSDEALEAGVHGGSIEAGNYTLAFCTALTDCPGP